MAQTIAASFELEALTMDASPIRISSQLRLAAYPARHAVPSAALRFSAGPHTVTFSSDTGSCDPLIEAAANADLFLCEATYLDASQEELNRHGHLTPELAAVTASRASARHLVLTHLARASSKTAAVTAARRQTDSADVTAADSGATIKVALTG
jgi:ribonuclease BN (tRNA processing enzyme)